MSTSELQAAPLLVRRPTIMVATPDLKQSALATKSSKHTCSKQLIAYIIISLMGVYIVLDYHLRASQLDGATLADKNMWSAIFLAVSEYLSAQWFFKYVPLVVSVGGVIAIFLITWKYLTTIFRQLFVWGISYAVWMTILRRFDSSIDLLVNHPEELNEMFWNATMNALLYTFRQQ